MIPRRYYHQRGLTDDRNDTWRNKMKEMASGNGRSEMVQAVGKRESNGVGKLLMEGREMKSISF